VNPAAAGAGRGALAALVMAGAMFATANFTSPAVPSHFAVFLAASLCMIGAGRVSDRLWDGITVPALQFGSPRLCLLSRAPFRFMSGGIAFTTVLLVSKKMGWAPVRDIPVLDLFMTGGILAVCYYGFVGGVRGFRAGRASGVGHRGNTNSRDGGDHDENRTA